MLPILLLVLQVAGQQLQGPPARAMIQGRVIRAGAAAAAAPDGLSDARVELTPGNLSVITDGVGAFAFRNVAPGQYIISVTRDGFVPQEGGVPGLTAFGLSINLAGGQTLKDLVLPMRSVPAITGRLFDPHGESLAAGLVRAYLREYSPIGTRLKIFRQAMTNDMGEFRLFGLKFGEYFVSGGYGDIERAAAVGKTRLSANVSRADDGYVTIFYDGAEDLSRAQAAHLTPGAAPATLNIYLRDTARFKIRGRVLPLVADVQILLAPKGSDLTTAGYSVQPDANGAFEIRGVCPGGYVLLATTADRAMASDVVALNVTDSDINGVRLALEKTVSISGALSLEGSPRTNLSAFYVRLLRSTLEFDQKIETRAAPDGTFTLEHVTPSAEYDIVVDPLPPGTYVKSIDSRRGSLLPGKVRLVSNEPMKIVLAPATGKAKVHVAKGQNPVAGAQVVLIPDPPLRRRADRYVTGFTDKAGDLEWTAAPPGGYTAYAFEHIEPGMYYALSYDPVAGDRFRDRGSFVTVVEKATPVTPLRVIPVEETAGGLQ